MLTVLVVVDSAIDRRLAAALIDGREGWRAAHAEDGRAALARLRAAPPDLVLTDLQTPALNGLELVEAVRAAHPGVPVVLLTAHGGEDLAVEALRKGAASYVARRNLARDLIATIESVLPAAAVHDDRRKVQSCLDATEFFFLLGNDTGIIQPLVAHLQEELVERRLVEEGELVRVATALYEVLLNAIEHGNLELSSQLREVDDGVPYRRLADERRRQSPYKDRAVRLAARFTRDEAAFVVRDDGPGYDPDRLPDPTDPANLERASGRGLLLTRMFMDEVRLNARGNEITLVKRRPPAPACRQ